MQTTQAELTIKAVLIGIFLALILCGTNVYLGLKIGNTISASIPASILAMGMLRMFKNYSVLENNISQTIASAGEAIAAIVIFVFPALLILGTWQHFGYWSITGLSICGGIVGIVFSIILRKVLLNDRTLTFPEGQAIGTVLLAAADSNNKAGLKAMVIGMLIAGTLNFCQSGLQILAGSYLKVIKVGKAFIGMGTGFSAALIGAGYLVGFNSTFVAAISSVLGWTILLAFFSLGHIPDNASDITSSAFIIWKQNVRPIGIGVLIFSGFATIISLAKPIFRGVRESIVALKNIGQIDETERDLNIKKMLVVLIIASIPIAMFICYQLNEITSFSLFINIIITLILIILILILGFMIASVAGYFAGFVGSTNSPNSGLLFIAVISLSLIFGVLVSGPISHKLATLFITVIFLVAFIGFGACITNDNIQDFKSGQIVGASPYKQQIALFFGVIASAFVAPLLIELVYQAYGIGGIVPHPGIDPENTLSAPQATAIAMLTKNILFRSQNWSLILYGILIGAVALVIDMIIRKKYRVRCPIVSVGLGVYLPPDVVITLFIGGIIRLLVTKKHNKLKQIYGAEHISRLSHKTNLLVCGLVAGESLMGLILAVPFVLYQSSDALKIVSNNFLGISQILSALVVVALCTLIYRSAQTD